MIFSVLQEELELNWKDFYPNLPSPKTYEDHIEVEKLRKKHIEMMTKVAEALKTSEENEVEIPKLHHK